MEIPWILTFRNSRFVTLNKIEGIDNKTQRNLQNCFHEYEITDQEEPDNDADDNDDAIHINLISVK